MISRERFAAIGPIEVCFPRTVEDNGHLAAEHPAWDMEVIGSKTGIYARHIAGPDQCASDLGVAAAEKLFACHGVDRTSIDFLLFCTQTPDYPLPPTACLIQDRLKLSRSIGALDYNLGCSGFVYGLALADGLIRAGTARRVLLITAETYSKYIHPADRSLRTIFGDAAAATLVEASAEPSLGSFAFGTDGRGAGALIVTDGGARPETTAIRPTKRRRWPSRLFMDGPGLISFTLDAVPRLVDRLLAQGRLTRDQIDLFLMHQATRLMLEHLRDRLGLDADRVPEHLENCGNTVSATVPILIRELRSAGRLRPGKRCLQVGFGVGFSWAGCVWTETWEAGQAGYATYRKAA
jgi:3-oxoacyl-[acyl-carrier-protein] synthase-3